MTNQKSDSLEVWLDCNLFESMQRIGTLSHQHGHVRFHYAKEWLSTPRSFNIDPDLSLDQGEFHPHPELGAFGIFMDSAPDRWGQTLMKRREAQEAKDEDRPPRILHAWDFLIGVQDQTRQGALRFKKEGTGIFLDDHELPAPPVTHLKELEDVAYKLSDKYIDDLKSLRKWLSVLVAPGSSLGGARPKANFTETDGSLWIAKFPAKDEPLDVGSWEMLTHKLAGQAKIDVPEAKIKKFGNSHHTFCVKRFDREGSTRIFYASALTLLQVSQSEGQSYLNIAQFIQENADPDYIDSDLEQLFRRVAFNVMVGNKDDHLRNHGFILTGNGWRLSKAFDVNPNIDKLDHVLNIDDSDNRPDLKTVLQTATFYNLSTEKALSIIKDTGNAVQKWESEAAQMGIARADIEIMRPAFLQANLATSLPNA